MSVVALIQARMSSSRLPGKVLKDLSGKPVLAWVVDAARHISGVDQVVVATSEEEEDNDIESFCEQQNIAVYRGSRDDVLERMTHAAKEFNAKTVIRITADCPLLDPFVCGMLLQLHKTSGAGYTSNIEPATWPDGLDCEVMTMDALETANRHGRPGAERDHITLYLRNRRSQFQARNLSCPIPKLDRERWTLDDEGDYAFLQAVTSKLAVLGRPPSFMEVMGVLQEHPEFYELRKDALRDEGTKKSVLEDEYQSFGYERSAALLQRAEKHIPLGAQTFSKSKIQFPAGKAPLFLSHGKGSRVWDVDGNEYVDMISALLPNVLGYCDPDIDAAVREQINNGVSFSLATELEAQLAEALSEIIPCAEMSRFGKNGSDATSAAIRLARAATGKDHVIVMGYHGWQDWYIGSTARHLGVPNAVRNLTHTVPFNDLDALACCFDEFPDDVAAVIMEPVGFLEPNQGYLEAVKELTHQKGALLVFDEVITGFRVHIGGAQSHYGVTPDLAAFGKGIANGLPLSVVVGKAKYMRLMEDIFYSGTFGGETLSLAAGLAVVKKMRGEPVIETLWKTGGTLSKRIQALLDELELNDVMALKGLAPWTIWQVHGHEAADANAIKTRFIIDMLANGVLIAASHNISYSHNEYDIEWVMRAYEKTLSRIRDELRTRTLVDRLETPILQPVFQVRKSA